MRYIKILCESVLAVLVCIAVGFSLLVAAYSIPTDKMENNVAASTGIFKTEGAHPRRIYLGVKSAIDNYTDALMLMTAAYSKKDTSVINRAMSAYRPTIKGQDPSDVLVSVYGKTSGEAAEEGSKPKISTAAYARYWHGYLVVLKPVLTALNYSQIRVLNAVVVSVLAVLLIVLLYIRQMGRFIIPYVITLLFIDPIAISRSMQFMDVYCVYSISVILYLLLKDWFDAKEERIILFFVVIGCMTSYLDLLTYPLTAWGIPAVVYLCSSQKSTKETVKVLLLTLIFWFIGYVGMWTGKWVLGTAIGEQNVIAQAISTVQTRSSIVVDNRAISIWYMIFKQVRHLLAPVTILFVIYIAIAVYRLKHYPEQYKLDSNWILYVAISIVPFFWYLGTSNHSYIHHWMTYRSLAISVLAILCMYATIYFKGEIKHQHT